VSRKVSTILSAVLIAILSFFIGRFSNFPPSDPTHPHTTLADRLITPIRPWAEFAYFISSILLIVAAMYGAQQIFLLKRDIITRNRRAAQERACDYCERYATFVMLRRKFIRECENLKLPIYSEPTQKFNIDALSSEWQKTVKEKMKLDSSVKALNLLELIAMAFLTGVADEQAGFKTIGSSFCGIVVTHYDIFTVRGSIGNHFQNVRELYLMWSSRLSLEELGKERQDLEARIKATPNQTIPPIGLD
jgi:hypothetical protein